MRPRRCSSARPEPDVWRPRRDGEEEPETPRTGQTDDWIASLSGIEELQFSISFCQFLEKFNFSQKKRTEEGVKGKYDRFTLPSSFIVRITTSILR